MIAAGKPCGWCDGQGSVREELDAWQGEYVVGVHQDYECEECNGTGVEPGEGGGK